MDNEFIMVESDNSGVFSEAWPEPLVVPPLALLRAMGILRQEDFNRCGCGGKAKFALAKTEFGLWVAAYFLSEEPSGGASLLMSRELREVVSPSRRFDFDKESELGAEELAGAALNDPVAFENLYKAMAGHAPPEAIW